MCVISSLCVCCVHHSLKPYYVLGPTLSTFKLHNPVTSMSFQFPR